MTEETLQTVLKDALDGKCENPANGSTSARMGCYSAGDRVRLTKNIWDDGEDHHPPGYIAEKGDIVIVRHVNNFAPIEVSPDGGVSKSFVVYASEISVCSNGLLVCYIPEETMALAKQIVDMPVMPRDRVLIAEGARRLATDIALAGD